MTIRPGEEWGRPVDPAADPHGYPVVHDDAELARVVATGGTGPFVVERGDLHRAVGSPLSSHRTQVVPVDALEVSLDDGPPIVVVGHLVARRPGPLGWWRGPILVALNGDHIGPWNVAPRAHPNDGRVDIVEVAPGMGVRARWQAWRRLPTGTHLPHPGIEARSARGWEREFDRPRAVWLDGVRAPGVVRRVLVTVRPDAFELVI